MSARRRAYPWYEALDPQPDQRFERKCAEHADHRMGIEKTTAQWAWSVIARLWAQLPEAYACTSHKPVT